MDVFFRGIQLSCPEGCFQPKPQTEHLVAFVLERVALLSSLTIIVEACAGIGNIAVSLALRLPFAVIYGADISAAAVNAARLNAARHSVEHRVTFFQGDFLQPLKETPALGSTDIIVCNPPYIPSHMTKHLPDEPRHAIDGGLTGFKYYKKLVSEAHDFLKPGGLLAVETGSERQADYLAETLEDTGRYGNIDVLPCPDMNEVVVMAARAG